MYVRRLLILVTRLRIILHINELKSDYKRVRRYNSQIQTLDDANNNYYLNKEYYKYLDTPVFLKQKIIVDVSVYKDTTPH